MSNDQWGWRLAQPRTAVPRPLTKSEEGRFRRQGEEMDITVGGHGWASGLQKAALKRVRSVLAHGTGQTPSARWLEVHRVSAGHPDLPKDQPLSSCHP